MDAILKASQEELFLKPGQFLALRFKEGYACFRIMDIEWSNMQSWPLGAVAAGGNLTDYNPIQDPQENHYLEPADKQMIYHTFWGVTPSPARIFVQFPGRQDIGSMKLTPRLINGNIGFIDGYKSPFWGPYSRATEVITVRDVYPQFQCFNPTGDAMTQVLMNFDQRHYTYSIIKSQATIAAIVSGKQPRKMYTMGPAWNSPMACPEWLRDLLTKRDPKTGSTIELLPFSLMVDVGA